MRNRDALLIGAAAGAVAGGLAWFVTRQRTAPGEVAPIYIGETFPTLVGRLLDGQPFTIPDDLQGTVGVLVLGWDYAARDDVDGWARALAETYGERPDLRVLQMPMISGVGALMRRVIDAAMERGTPAAARQHVLTVYGDLRWLQRRLGSADGALPDVFLLGRSGRLTWRTSGSPTPDRLAALHNALRDQGIAPG